ncbi:MAG: prepilin-type N-terminal cleavage/methylation domain-containing protein [Arenimonas sp.]
MKRCSGFTLLEMLVVTGLMALIVLLGLNLMRSTAASATKSEASAERNENLRSVQSFMRRQITGALPIAYEFDASNGEATYFAGERNKLQLVANMPGYLSYGGAYLQTFELKRSGENYQLEFQFQQITSEGLLDAERKPEILLDGIKSGEFSYRTLDEQSQPGDWKHDWEVPTQIPMQTRLNIEFADKKMHWPSLVAASKLSSATSGSGNPGLQPRTFTPDPELGGDR